MIVTAKFLLDNTTKSGSWTRTQFESLGIEWQPPKGWKKKVIGKEITDKQAEDFINGKEIFANTKKIKSKISIKQPSLF